MADTMNASTSIEANLGNVSGQVAFGNYNVQISADHGAVVNLSSPERQPIPRPHHHQKTRRKSISKIMRILLI